ncbi:TPA: transposase, partial [Streptococcus agalactiae]|nr:transposase [Streptococcus agalactiae]HEN7902985.1 transposase [Streptococcus agalactiae]
CRQFVVLADLGYLSQELKETLQQEGYHLWTPLRQNMVGAKQHNHWQLLVMRRTIETRFSELYSLFNIEHTLTRSITGLQLRIEQIIMAYHLRYF